MPTHNDVATTCTASLITGWDIPNLTSNDKKTEVNIRLQTVENLIRAGYKKDFSILFAITTDQQINKYGLDDFLPRVGFEKSFHGPKAKEGPQRHKETGDLTMWCVTPDEYEDKLKAYKKELTEIKDRIDPPKKIDPARQKYPDLLLSHLRKEGIVQNNAAVDNPIREVLLVSADTAWAFIKLKFGVDIKQFRKIEDWTRITTRQLKQAQRDWKQELV